MILSTSPNLAMLISAATGLLYWGSLAVLLWSMKASLPRRGDVAWLVLAGVLSLITISPGLLGNLRLIPDSPEQALAALEWIATGRYGILINEAVYPPRYPPFFSIAVLAPWSLLIGPTVLATTLPGFLHLLISALFAYAFAARTGRPTAGVFCALTLLSFAPLVKSAGEVLTHLPTVTITLGLLALWEHPQKGTLRLRLLTVILLTSAMLLRPLNFCLVLPWLLSRRNRDLFLAASSITVAYIGTALYNQVVFGSWLRTGYHYWCPIPYDSFTSTFKLDAIAPNLAALWSSGALAYLGLSMIGYAWRHRFQDHLSHSQFLIFGPATIALLHLFYFFPNTGFFLPLIATAIVLGISQLSNWLHTRRTYNHYILGFLALLIATNSIGSVTRQPAPSKIEVAAAIARSVPSNSVLISGLDPVYLRLMLPRAQSITYLPPSRRVEYASKFLAPLPLASQAIPPESEEARAAWLRESNTIDVFPQTALTSPEVIPELLGQGKMVFIETSRLTELEKEAISHSCRTRETDHHFLLLCAG